VLSSLLRPWETALTTTHPSRAAAARRWLALALFALAAASTGLALVPSADADDARAATSARHVVDRDTVFEYVAVFPAGTAATRIEAWRQQVLVRNHRQPCFHGWPCLARLLRVTGTAGSGDALAFDLQADTAAVERAAILAAAVAVEPRPRLVRDASAGTALALAATSPLPMPAP
jgi:hypothetical protein